MWLEFRIAVTRIALNVLLPVLQGLNDYAKYLAGEAKIELSLPPKPGKPEPMVRTVITNCAVCNYAWHEQSGVVLSDIECPNCGAQAAFMGPDR